LADSSLVRQDNITIRDDTTADVASLAETSIFVMT
jgi:hypothetical protein